MFDAFVLNLVLFLPLFGAALLLAAPAEGHDFTRKLTLAVMTVSSIRQAQTVFLERVNDINFCCLTKRCSLVYSLSPY